MTSTVTDTQNIAQTSSNTHTEPSFFTKTKIRWKGRKVIDQMRTEGWQKQHIKEIQAIHSTAMKHMTFEDLNALSGTQAEALRKNQLREMTDEQFLSILPKLSTKQIISQLKNIETIETLLQIHDNMSVDQRSGVLGPLHHDSLYDEQLMIPKHLLQVVENMKSGVVRMLIAVIQKNHKSHTDKIGLLYKNMSENQRIKVNSHVSARDVAVAINHMGDEEACSTFYSFKENRRIEMTTFIPENKLEIMNQIQLKRVQESLSRQQNDNSSVLVMAATL